MWNKLLLMQVVVEVVESNDLHTAESSNFNVHARPCLWKNIPRTKNLDEESLVILDIRLK